MTTVTSTTPWQFFPSATHTHAHIRHKYNTHNFDIEEDGGWRCQHADQVLVACRRSGVHRDACVYALEQTHTHTHTRTHRRERAMRQERKTLGRDSEQSGDVAILQRRISQPMVDSRHTHERTHINTHTHTTHTHKERKREKKKENKQKKTHTLAPRSTPVQRRILHQINKICRCHFTTVDRGLFPPPLSLSPALLCRCAVSLRRHRCGPLFEHIPVCHAAPSGEAPPSCERSAAKGKTLFWFFSPSLSLPIHLLTHIHTHTHTLALSLLYAL